MARESLLYEETTRSILGAFFEVYNDLGYGFLESTYCAALEIELQSRNHVVEREAPVQVFYKGHPIARHRLDMVVDGKVILEVKSTAALPPSANRQLLNYLRASDLQLGFVLHFGPEAKFYRQFFDFRKPNVTPFQDPSNPSNP